MAPGIFSALYKDFIKPLEKQLVTLFVFIIFIVAGYYGYNWYARSTIENLSNTDMSNNNRRISDAKIMFFFADWCPHCKKAKPEWEKFTATYNNKDVGFYKIICDSVDCTDGENRLIQEYSIDGYPTVILVKDGKRVNFSGRITESNLNDFIESECKN
jgi:thiol-disulfide isomerase/thioredoxin